MYKIKERIKSAEGKIFGYILIDEKGNTQDILAKQLIQYIDTKKISVGIPTNKGVKAATKEDIYADLGVLFVLVAIVGEVYVVVNQKTKEQKKVSKDELVKGVSSGAILVSNIYLRKTAKGGVSIVCKEPEKVKRMEAKPTTEQIKKVEDTHEGKVHYKGKLGDFWYDPTEFEVLLAEEVTDDEFGSLETCLYYIGKKTKGIVIPEGITICKYMFYGCSRLVEAPEIPEGVKNCDSMFAGCRSLKEAPAIPKGVKDCYAMFYACTSLQEAPVIPKGVTNCYSMFMDCKSLVEAPAIPKGVKDCERMFAACVSLVKAPEISQGATNCRSMFDGCTSLKEAPAIPEGVTNCWGMFKNCTNLEKASIIPSSVTNCACMFDGCISLVKAPKIPQGVTNCEYMFAGCTSLKEASEIPKGVTNCWGMFRYCASLVKAPEIPSSVTNCEDMFDVCSEEVRKQGAYNIEHRV